MNAQRFLFGSAILAMTAFSAGCLDEKIVAPDDQIPPILAIDRPTVQLFRFARGRKVEADTVRITNNGEGPLGVVEQVGGVDYITTARVGWLDATIEMLNPNEALLILVPTYAEDEQDEADVAEVVLRAQGSLELKRVKVIARTLRGATFEFSVSPLAFAAVPGDPAMTQRLTVRNGGNGTLQIHPPTVRYKGAVLDWLSLEPAGGSETAPQYQIHADPGTLGGGLFEAFLIFESPLAEETRAKTDSVSVLLNIGQPTLRVSTSTLAFTVLRGGEDPAPQTVLLSNSGEGSFDALGTLELGDVTYGEGAEGWLEPTLSGSQLLVEATTTGLDAGEYKAAFPVVSTNGGTRSIQVTLSVEAPILTPSTRTVSFGMVEGDADPPTPQKVAITNTGSGTFEALGPITLGSFQPVATWMGAELVEDTLILTPTMASTSLTAGDHTTRLPVQSAYGGGDTLSIILSVSRGLDPPNLALSALQVELSGISGDPSPSPQEVQISNAGGGTLGAVTLGTIAYPGLGGWLSATLAGNTITLTATTGALPDGNHFATVPVSSANGGDETIDVTFAIGSPILTASATSASFSAVEGGGNPSNQTITFTNTGPGSFSSLGAVTVGAVSYPGVGGWLSTGYVDGPPEGTLTLSVTTGALAPGTYSATVPVNSAEGGSVSIAVTFTVTRLTDAADLVVSPSTVRMDAVRGGADPPSQTVLLSNGGGGSLGALGVSGITYGGGAAGWLSASLAGSTVTLDATTGALASGTYDATVGLTSANGGNESVDVTFVVAAPNLTLSAASASFSGEEGGTASPASVSIDISNTGAGSFSSLGTITLGTPAYGGGGAGWLSSSLGGGGTTVDLSATLGALGAGTYTATLPVNSTAGGSESVDVTFTVAPVPAPPVLVLSATSATFYAEEGGGDPDSQDISIANGGGGGIADLGALSIVAAGEAWLSESLAGTTVTLSATTGALTAAGSPYTGTVTVESVDGGTDAISVTFRISAAGAAADLAVSPASVRMDAVAGGSDPSDQEVLLYNAGGGPLGALSVVGITYLDGDGWLAASLVSATLTLSGDVTGLAAGSYDATVEVSSVNGGNENIDVTLVVAGPVLTLSSTSASFSGAEGGAASPASVTVSFSNTGAGNFASLGTITLGAPVYGGVGGWLTSDLAVDETSVDLSVTLGALAAGTYTATLPVNSTEGGSGSIDITFTVTRTLDAPSLSLSASAASFTAVLGGSSPPSKSISLFNSGGGTLSDLGTLGIGTITYGGGANGWLSTSSLAGSTLTLSPVTGSLAAGTHTATVPVTSEFGGDRSVAVTVEVGSPVLTASTLGLSFTGLVDGAAPGGQTVTFSNTGVGDYGDLGSVTVGAIAYGGGAAGWLDEPANGDPVVGGSLDFSVDQAGVAPGSYTATVPVASQHGGSESITVTLSVVRETDPPVMVLSATTQRFDALVGGTNPSPQSVIASNAGGGSLGAITLGAPSYGVGASGWLSGTVSGTTITTRAQTGSLAEGTYHASLPVSSAGGNQSIDVTFVVGTSRLTLAPRTVSFGDTVRGSGPAPVLVSIANTGGGSYTSLGTITLGSTVYGDGATGWLEATKTAPDSIRVRAITGDLLSRMAPYVARVPVLSTLGGSDTIQVAFTVAPGTSPPSLSLSLDSMTFAGILGGEAPTAQTVSGYNSGGGSLGTLTVSEIVYENAVTGWLSGSVSGSTVTLLTDVAGVPGGTHRASVTIASENGGSRSLEVALVLAPPILGLSSQTVTFSDTVGSPDTLQSQVFISNIGAGNRASLGIINLGTIAYLQGEQGWLITEPGQGEVVEGFQVGLKGSASDLPEGNWVALVPVESEWGGADTVAVTFAAREPDRSFDLPTIELVKDTLVNGNTVQVPLPGDSVVVGPVTAGPAELGVRVGVRNGSQTRVTLSGLRVGIPSYPEGQAGGWITGAFLDRTTASFDDPAELFSVVVTAGLAPGRYEGRLVVSSESAGLEEVAPRVLRVVLIVR